MQKPPALKQLTLQCRGFFACTRKAACGRLGPRGSLFVYCWLSMAVSQASAWA